MVPFVVDHRTTYGVEPICHAIGMAPSTCYVHHGRTTAPERAPARTKREAVLRPAISRCWHANQRVDGAKKVWWVADFTFVAFDKDWKNGVAEKAGRQSSFGSKARGAYFGNLLSPSLLAQIGGEAALRDTDASVIETLEDGWVYVQLTDTREPRRRA
jgi:hypothetical protein